MVQQQQHQLPPFLQQLQQQHQILVIPKRQQQHQLPLFLQQRHHRIPPFPKQQQ